eukprot:2436209-Alexandrium_andersonii.AAC.1
MPVISMLRKLIWEQTETVVMADVQLDAPEVAVPAQRTYVVERWPLVRWREGQPDGTIRVRFQPEDMLEVARGYASQGCRVAVLSMAAKSHPGG